MQGQQCLVSLVVVAGGVGTLPSVRTQGCRALLCSVHSTEAYN